MNIFGLEFFNWSWVLTSVLWDVVVLVPFASTENTHRHPGVRGPFRLNSRPLSEHASCITLRMLRHLLYLPSSDLVES